MPCPAAQSHPIGSTAIFRGKAEPFAHEEDERGKEDAQRHQKVGIEKISRRPYALIHCRPMCTALKQTREDKIDLMPGPRHGRIEKIRQK